MTFREIIRTPEFERDLKKLDRRFRTLPDDLEVFIRKQLVLSHKLMIDNSGVEQIPGVGTQDTKVFKGKKFACRSLKGRGVHSGIRVIYSYCEKTDRIQLIEIYFKGDKPSEDRSRLMKLI